VRRTEVYDWVGRRLRPLALRHDPHDLPQGDRPAVMQTIGNLATGLGSVLREQVTHQLLIAIFAGAEHFHSDKLGMVALLLHELVRGVPDKREATGHACSEVGASGPEDEDGASGHVLASVIADTFDHGRCA